MRKHISVLRNSPSRFNKVGPLHFSRTVLLKCQFKSRKCPRYTGRTITDIRGTLSLDQVAVLINEQIPMRGPRSHLAIIDRGCLTIRLSDQHETAAADVPSLGIHNSQCKAYCYCSIHRISAFLQDSYTDLRCDRVL